MNWKYNQSPLDAFPLSLCLLGANIVLFGMTDLGLLGERGAAIKEWGVNSQAGWAAGEIWRPLTAIFLHGGPLHILLNASALWQLCPSFEKEYGTARFAAVYFGAGLAGSFASLAFEFASLGASGAICGVLAAYVRQDRVLLGSWRAVRRDPVAGQFLVWLVLTIAFGFAVPNISNAGHLGGLAGGWIVFAALVPAGKGMERGRLIKKLSPVKLAAAVLLLAGAAVASIRPPWHAVAWYEKAREAAARGDLAKGRECLEKAKAAPFGGHPTLGFQYGNEEFEAGRYESALLFYRAAESEGLFRNELAHNIALVLRKLGRKKELLEHLRTRRPEGWDSELNELEQEEKAKRGDRSGD